MLKNTIVVTLLLILSSILGFIAQIVFVSKFGASVEMDIYFTLLSIPTVITGIIPVIFSSVLIPTFAGFKSSKTELDKFINSVWKFIFILAVSFTLIGYFITYINMDLFLPKNGVHYKNIGIQVSLMIWIGSGFSFMSSYLAAILNYNKQFFKVAWTSLLPAFFMIIIVLLFHENLGIFSISLGLCIAFTLQFIIFLKASKISLFFFSFNIKEIPYKKLLLKQSSLVILSLLPFTILVPIAYYWASGLEKGSVSYLGYSQSFAGFLSVAVGMGISIVSFPELAEKFASGKGESSLYAFEKKLKYVLLIAMFAAGAFISLKIPILTLFYQRGSFDVESVNNLARVVPWYLMAAVFVAGLNLLRTLFYSKGEFGLLARFGLVIPVLFFIMAGVLKEEFSYVGIGIANALSFAVLFFITVYLAKNKEAMFLTKNFYFFIIKNTLAVIIAGFFVTLALPFISIVNSQIISISFCLFLFSVVYFLFSKFIFKLKEIKEIQFVLMTKIK